MDRAEPVLDDELGEAGRDDAAFLLEPFPTIAAE
jgi:hypothetical protein